MGETPAKGTPGGGAEPSRRAAIGTVAIGGGLALLGAGAIRQFGGEAIEWVGAITPESAGDEVPGPRLILADDPTVHIVAPEVSPQALLAASRALLAISTVVVVADLADRAATSAASACARGLGIPLLPLDADLAGELDRLGVVTVVSYAGAETDLGGREAVAGPVDGSLPAIDGLPLTPPEAAAILLAEDEEVPEPLLALAASAGATEARIAPDGDPRKSIATIRALRAAPVAPVLAVGAGFGGGERLAARVGTARTAVQFPGESVLPLHRRRMIALYGSPLTASLGMLGEQPAQEAADRVIALTEEYRTLLDDDRVYPAFELIATVAAGQAGPDGTYSNVTDPDVLAEWIDVAEANEIYCILDLQPGRADFLTQAKIYTDLLRRPHVGLAIDPEWRLQPGEVPLTRIGHVEVDEVNAVADWLAELTRAEGLPPKVLTLHQFQTQMIRDRDRLVLDHDEIAMLVHVDGSGGQGAKQSTWRTIRDGLPASVYLGWKNFEHEDFPMLTPAETVATVEPMPAFVSYQ